MFKIYVQIGGGAYFCHRCGAKGSWYDFKMKLGGYEVVDAMGRSAAPNTAAPTSSSMRHSTNRKNPSGGRGSDGNGNGAPLPMPSQRLQAAYITNLVNGKNKGEQEALAYLKSERGLTKQTLRKYGVGLGVYNFPSSEPGQHGRYIRADCVTFPWIMRASEVHFQERLRGASYNWEKDTEKDQVAAAKKEKERTKSKDAAAAADGTDEEESREITQEKHGPFVTRRIKARALDNKSWQRLDPPGGGWGLFGWHTIPPNSTEIVLTEGEYDAMAVYQATGRPAISLPNGCRSLPVEVLPMLERFDKIFLWMDNDGPGREGAEQFAKKIGINRCYLVQPDPSQYGGDAPKDANDALLNGFDLDELIMDSEISPHERILSFGDLRSQVLHEIQHPDKYKGVGVPSLPDFTGIIKGFRRGELTVLTGPTGSGKTTFLGQLSLDFAEQKVNTLWGSFEIKNTRLLKKLLEQYNRDSLPDESQKLEALADRFEQLPLSFMKFHGGSDVDDVLDAMEYASYVLDVEHIILDNMQFMITRETGRSNSTFDKFDMQDIAIEKFRKFATEKNVHVTLVVHPRKEDEGARLGMSSIYGSAKATQEADTVLILQNDANKRKFIEVKKNRFDGTLGYAPLHFQHDSGRYSHDPGVIIPTSQADMNFPTPNKFGRIVSTPLGS